MSEAEREREVNCQVILRKGEREFSTVDTLTPKKKRAKREREPWEEEEEELEATGENDSSDDE